MDNPVCDICGGKLDEIKPKEIKRLVYIPSQLYIEKQLFISMYVIAAVKKKKLCISSRKKDMKNQDHY